MNKDQFLAALRHLLTVAGGYAIAKGWFDSALLNDLVSVVLVIGGYGWSWAEKRDTPPVVAPAVKLMVLCLAGLTATGCATQFATETVRGADGTLTIRRLVHNAILNKSALTNLAFAKKTKTTESLLSYDSAQTETQAEVMSKLVEGAVAGAVKGVK